jgi:hypothetical protein
VNDTLNGERQPVNDRVECRTLNDERSGGGLEPFTVNDGIERPTVNDGRKALNGSVERSGSGKSFTVNDTLNSERRPVNDWVERPSLNDERSGNSAESFTVNDDMNDGYNALNGSVERPTLNDDRRAVNDPVARCSVNDRWPVALVVHTPEVKPRTGQSLRTAVAVNALADAQRKAKEITELADGLEEARNRIRVLTESRDKLHRGLVEVAVEGDRIEKDAYQLALVIASLIQLTPDKPIKRDLAAILCRRLPQDHPVWSRCAEQGEWT